SVRDAVVDGEGLVAAAGTPACLAGVVVSLEDAGSGALGEGGAVAGPAGVLRHVIGLPMWSGLALAALHARSGPGEDPGLAGPHFDVLVPPGGLGGEADLGGHASPGFVVGGVAEIGADPHDA